MGSSSLKKQQVLESNKDAWLVSAHKSAACHFPAVWVHMHAQICLTHHVQCDPRFKFINEASKLANTAITPSKINSCTRGRREPLCVCVCLCARVLCVCARARDYSSAVSSAEESVWTTAGCFGSPTAPRKATQPLYLLQISPRRPPCAFPGSKLCLHSDTQARSW